MTSPDLQTAADAIFKYCCNLGHRMGSVQIKPVEEGAIFINIRVLDACKRPLSRADIVKGIVDDTEKLIECGCLMSEMLLSDISTKH